VREFVEVVFFIVDFDGGHGISPFINEKNPQPFEPWGGRF
jgi:hypothetical protein